MSKRPYKDFDLPTKHIEGERHYIPPKARDRAEIERRKSQPAGTLLAEHQHAGLAVATIMLGILQDTDDIMSAASFIVPAGLNSAWYSHAQHSQVMRRRLKLAKLATEDPEQRPTSYMLHHEATDLFGKATDAAKQLVLAIRHQIPEGIFDSRKELLYTLGHASLVLDSVSIGDQVGWDIQVTDFDLQDLARKRALNALERSRALQAEIGEPPTMAAFGDYDGLIARELRKNATDAVVEAYQTGFEQVVMAA